MQSLEHNHTQRKPDGWDELIASAASSLDSRAPDYQQFQALASVWQAATNLDSELFEANRYYGLQLAAGAFVCGVAANGGAKALIEEASSSLARNHRRYCSTYLDSRQGLYLREVEGGPAGVVSHQNAREAYHTLGLPDRLTSDTLQWMKSVGRQTDPKRLGDHAKQWVLGQEYSLRTVAASSFTGASITTQAILQRLYERQTGKPWPAQTLFNPPIEAILQTDQLESLDLTGMTPAAGLRLDELRNVYTVTRLDDCGKGYLDRSLIPKEPGQVQQSGDSTIDHISRLRCPALPVAGAILMVMQIMPRILASAQRQLGVD